MKKLLKSKIYGSMNRAQNPHVAENWLKSQTFRQKKEKKKKKEGRNANGLQTHTLTTATMPNSYVSFRDSTIQLPKNL